MNSAPQSPARPPSYVLVGRYAIFDEIAAGGMATVHLGRLLGAGGFSRVVAIKKLHPQFSKDDEFSAMFMDEARLAARIRHANVVQTLDVVTVDDELLLVMEYVHGVSFAALLHASRKLKQRVDPRIAAAVVAGTLEGLHAAHEIKSEVGVPLGVVHRDVSPQNVMVGVDGIPRILDFGVAKAVGKMHATRDGQLKGKLAYMSPEQVRSELVTRQSDVFSAAIVLWEALMGKRLFDGQNPAEIIVQVMSDRIVPPRERFPDLPQDLEDVVMKGLSRDPLARYATAREMAIDLEQCVPLAPPREIARWAEELASDTLRARSQLVERIERAAAEADEAVASGPALPFATTVSMNRGPIGDRDAESGPRSRPILRSDAPPTGKERTLPSARASGRPPPPRPPRPPVPNVQERSALPDPGFLDVPPTTRTAPPGIDTGVATPAGRALPQPLADWALPDPGLPRSPDGVPTPPSSGSPAPPPASSSGRRPISEGSPGQASMAPSAPLQPRARRIPLHIEPQEEPVSLRERIENPLKVVAAGVLLSVADPLLRPLLGDFPIRPLWIAEVLVVAGVLWIVARLMLPARRRRD
jgi:serine/threonine-protein kinase